MRADASQASPVPPAPRFYVPGHARWKFVLCVCGLAVFLLGASLLWPPLRLVLFGRRAQAVATRIIRTKPGSPDLAVRDDHQTPLQTGPRDDDAVFWNEFSFQTTTGHTVTVRDNVGSRHRALYPLIDPDGLPTTALVCYDARRPEVAVFPGEFSTWLVPVGLTLAGLACAIICAVLLYWAEKPIALPEITPS